MPIAHPAVEIDAVDAFEKAVHEMLPRLLAVADDVDAGVLLELQREQRGVALALARAPRRRAATAPRASAARQARRASAGCRRWWFRARCSLARGAAVAVLGYRCEPVNPVCGGEAMTTREELRRDARRDARPAVRGGAADPTREPASGIADLVDEVTFGAVWSRPGPGAVRPHDRDTGGLVCGAAAESFASLRRRRRSISGSVRRRSSRSSCNAASTPASRPARRPSASPARSLPSAAVSLPRRGGDAGVPRRADGERPGADWRSCTARAAMKAMPPPTTGSPARSTRWRSSTATARSGIARGSTGGGARSARSPLSRRSASTGR